MLLIVLCRLRRVALGNNNVVITIVTQSYTTSFLVLLVIIRNAIRFHASSTIRMYSPELHDHQKIEQQN